MSKCKICKNNYAEWAMQFIDDDKPEFYFLGSHIRGFKVVKICNDCKEEKLKEARRV